MGNQLPLFLFVLSPCFLSSQFMVVASSQRSNVNSTTILFPVGVILDLETPMGKMAYNCISMAISDFYTVHSHYRTRLVLHPKDSKKDVVTAAFEALNLMKDAQVQAILGPQESIQAEFIADLGAKAHVPIISFSATNPSLYSRSPYFIGMIPNDSYQVKAIAAIVQAFGWNEVVTIHEDTDYGNGILPYLIDSFLDIDAQITHRSSIPVSATKDEINTELYKLMEMQKSVFVVHMSISLGPHFFQLVKDAGMMSEGYVWIITDGLSNLLDSLNQSVIDSMQGVLGIKLYVPPSEELDNLRAQWRRKFRRDNPSTEDVELSVYGLLAYDAVWMLATAVESVGSMHHRMNKATDLRRNSSCFSDHFNRASKFGSRVRKAILGTSFKGLSGDIRLLHGQPQQFVFQILNVIGKGERDIGFWIPMYGISRELNSSSREGNKKDYSTSKDDLGTVIWPGDSRTIPKGWVVPKRGGKLRIGVPVKVGFNEFVKVERDPKTKETKVSGYCIEVFNSVMEALPYNVPYEFVPFENENGESAGSYDDLVNQVSDQKYDAALGDIPATANWSSNVDFSQPFTNGGVSTIVPIVYEKNNILTLFKPMTWGLWFTWSTSFVFTGLLIFALGGGGDQHFSGNFAQQNIVATLSWLLFQEGEGNLRLSSMLILLAWFFELCLISQTYVSTLSSMLSAQQQYQPVSVSVNDLIANGDFVGYRNGSSVEGLLKQLGFGEAKLKVYNSPEEYNDALMRGSKNGGVAVIFDQIPYIKLFLNKYCGKYRMGAEIYGMDSFVYVFPRGSPLVADVSREILSMKGEKMAAIEKAWLGSPCTDTTTTTSSNPLTLEVFWVLFLVTGFIRLCAFIFSVLQRKCFNTPVVNNIDMGPHEQGLEETNIETSSSISESESSPNLSIPSKIIDNNALGMENCSPTKLDEQNAIGRCD